MADFTRAVEYTLAQEGGFSNDRADKGGATRFGISTPTLKEYQRKTGLLTGIATAVLTRDEAKAIYRAMFWHFDDLASQMIATKIFDLAVNMGPSAGVMLAQQAARSLGLPIAVDGVYGPQTAAALNSLSGGRKLLLFKSLVYQAAGRYLSIVATNPSQLDFIDGWLARCARRPQD